MTDFNNYNEDQTKEKVEEVVNKVDEVVKEAEAGKADFERNAGEAGAKSDYNASETQQPGQSNGAPVPPYNRPPQYNQQYARQQPPYQQQGQYRPPYNGPVYNQYPQQPTYNAYASRPVPQGYIQKNRIVAGLFGIIFGGIGLHNFYLGFTTRAVIQIVVSVITCGIGSLWGVIEGIMIIAGCYNNNCDANGIQMKEM